MYQIYKTPLLFLSEDKTGKPADFTSSTILSWADTAALLFATSIFWLNLAWQPSRTTKIKMRKWMKKPPVLQQCSGLISDNFQT